MVLSQIFYNVEIIIQFERYMYSLVPLIWATAADESLTWASCNSGVIRSVDAEKAAAAANALWLFNKLVTSCFEINFLMNLNNFPMDLYIYSFIYLFIAKIDTFYFVKTLPFTCVCCSEILFKILLFASSRAISFKATVSPMISLQSLL